MASTKSPDRRNLAANGRQFLHLPSAAGIFWLTYFLALWCAFSIF